MKTFNQREILFTTILFFCFLSPSLGQYLDNDNRGTQFSLHILSAFRIEEFSDADRNAFSKIGIEAQLSFAVNEKLGVQTKTAWIKWERYRETIFPLILGPEYLFLQLGSVGFTGYGLIGPTATFGNDYAGVFFSMEIGVNVSFSRGKGPVAGISFGKNAVFHPDEYSMLKAIVGWRF